MDNLEFAEQVLRGGFPKVTLYKDFSGEHLRGFGGQVLQFISEINQSVYLTVVSLGMDRLAIENLAELSAILLDEVIAELLTIEPALIGDGVYGNGIRFSLEAFFQMASPSAIELLFQYGNDDRIATAARNIVDVFGKKNALTIAVSLGGAALAGRLLDSGSIENAVFVAALALRVSGQIEREVSIEKNVASLNGTYAVSQREDQLLKPFWIAHCQNVFRSGVPISNITDLLNTDGYDIRIRNILPKTLKKWAKSVIPELDLKSGRPPKK